MKKRILVFDHERLLCHGLKKALGQKLLEVDTASTYGEAIVALNSRQYDLCLLDIRLPDESGFEMMEVMKHFCPKMKIILMTASDIDLDDDSNENIQKAKANGASHFLCKPFDLKQLKEIITRVLIEEGIVENADRFEESFAVSTRRRENRTKRSENIHFFKSMIIDGVVKRRAVPAETVDISADGIGLITDCPLEPTQVISFGEDLEQKSGVVVWSNLLEDQRCRAGIRFA